MVAVAEVLEAGFAATIQDLGRFAYQSAGFPVSGAMDALALRLANLLVHNADSAAAIEFCLVGPTLKFSDHTFIAITGGDAQPRLNNQEVPFNQALEVQPGDVLSFLPMKTSRYGYIAVANGGIQVPEVLDSRATTLKIKLGGYQGRLLAQGDRLPMSATHRMPSLAFRKTGFIGDQNSEVIRVVQGPQWTLFSQEAQAQFLKQNYHISSQADRMGYQLEGQPLPVPEANLLSEGTAMGNIQITRNGQPIVLLADRQTTGGYPVIATVAGADLSAFVQRPSSKPFTFQLVSAQKATDLLLAQYAQLTQLDQQFQNKRYQYPVGPVREAAGKLAQLFQ